MKKFWQFARLMLRFKRLLVLGIGGALLDAVCFMGGIASLLWVVHQLFNENRLVRQVVRDKLAEPALQSWIGDQTHLAQYIPAGQFTGVAFIFAIILLFALLGSLGRVLHQYTTITISLRSVMIIRKQVFQRLVHVPMLVLAESGAADKLSRTVGDTMQLSRGFNALTSKALRDVLRGMVMLGLALWFDWALTLIFLLGLPLIGLLIHRFGRTIRKASKRALVHSARMLAALQEALQAARVVKVHQAEGYERRRFNTINRRVYAEQMKARTVRAIASPVIELLGMVGVMSVALAAMYFVYHLELAEPSMIVNVIGALGIAAASFRPVVNLNNDLQEAAAAAERIDEVLQLPVEPNARGQTSHAPPLPRHRDLLSFVDVHFKYPQAQTQALAGINLELPFGTRCAIVGGNGSGKSTLVGLVPRLYEPTHGRVLIDGIDVGACSLRSVRNQIAMVTQETILFDGSIAENLTYGQRHVAEQRMIDAAKRAHAHQFIMSLPQGYDTPLGEWGSRLSGGQRQRISLARAILRDPAILILDEATSQIDAESEAKIVAALHEFAADRTTLVIAHRLSTVVNADMIVVLKSGELEATGTHEQLLETSPVYQTLCQTQLRS